MRHLKPQLVLKRGCDVPQWHTASPKSLPCMLDWPQPRPHLLSLITLQWLLIEAAAASAKGD